MNYQVLCSKCNEPLFGSVRYCPYCGFEFVSEKNNKDILRYEIDNSLIQGDFTPDIRKYIRLKGSNLNIPNDIGDALLLEALKSKGFIAEKEVLNDPLSVCWYSVEKKKGIEKEKVDKLRIQFDEVINKILDDGLFDKNQLRLVKEKGKEIGCPEEQTLNIFEKMLLANGFSPDPDASNNRSESILNKLSVVWRTEEKHFIESKKNLILSLEKFITSEIYNPEDYSRIFELAPKYFKNNKLKFDQVLLDFLVINGYKPISNFDKSDKLSIVWKIESANPLNIVNTESLIPAVEQPTKTLVQNKPVKNNYIYAIVIILIGCIGYYSYNNIFKTAGFLGKIDKALEESKYFSPPGENISEYLREKRVKEPNSPEINEAILKIKQKLAPVADNAIQRLYSDSDDTNWDNTVNILKLINEIVPDDKDILAKLEFSQGHQIIKSKFQKNYYDALVKYQKALDLKPNWVLALNGMAKVYVRKDSPLYNKEKALYWYGKVCEVDQKFPWAYTNIAAIYMEEQKWDLAEQALLRASNIKNNSSTIYADLGKVCEKQEKVIDAKNYYQTAIRYETDANKIAILQKRMSTL